MNPLVSICIPTYNGEKYLQEALDSVKSQTYKDIEVIISDDESKDSTLAICERFKEEVSFPVHIFRHKPQGIGANWDHCISKANGIFIKFLFQDDILEDSCVEEFIMLQEKTKEEVFFCQRKLIDGFGNDITDEIRTKAPKIADLQAVINLQFKDFYLFSKKSLKILRYNFFGNIGHNFFGEPVACFASKSAYLKTGKHNYSLKQLLDFDYALRLLKNYNIVITDRPLIRFRIHEQQTSHINLQNQINETEYVSSFIVANFYQYLHHRTILKYFYRKYPLLHNLRAKLPF